MAWTRVKTNYENSGLCYNWHLNSAEICIFEQKAAARGDLFLMAGTADFLDLGKTLYDVCMYVCMNEWMNEWMNVCIYVYIYVSINI